MNDVRDILGAVTNNQAPPTYNSMFGKIRQAKRDSQGSHMNFLQKTAGIILQSCSLIT